MFMFTQYTHWPAHACSLLTIYYTNQAKNDESKEKKPLCSHRRDNICRTSDWLEEDG